jgi:hypothetical protein
MPLVLRFVHSVRLATVPARIVWSSQSAAYRPRPKAAIPRWSGFDLESQDLQPDNPVNHSDGAAMNGFVDLHGELITGAINTFDRVIFKGHLNGFFSDGAFGRYLSRRGILLKDAGPFLEAETQRIRDHVVSLAAAAGRQGGRSNIWRGPARIARAPPRRPGRGRLPSGTE